MLYLNFGHQIHKKSAPNLNHRCQLQKKVVETNNKKSVSSIVLMNLKTNGKTNGISQHLN